MWDQRWQTKQRKKSGWLFSLTGKCVYRRNESWQNKKQSTISPVNRCDERHSRDLRPDPNPRPFNSERGAFYPLRYSATPTPRSHECFVQLVEDSFPSFSRNWQVNTLFNRPTERGKKEEKKKGKMNSQKLSSYWSWRMTTLHDNSSKDRHSASSQVMSEVWESDLSPEQMALTYLTVVRPSHFLSHPQATLTTWWGWLSPSYTSYTFLQHWWQWIKITPRQDSLSLIPKLIPHETRLEHSSGDLPWKSPFLLCPFLFFQKETN